MRQSIVAFLMTASVASPSVAQLPHVKDTLEDGRKVAFSPFLGRISLFTEHLGSGFFPTTLHVGYSLVKQDLFVLDLTVGLNVFRAEPQLWYQEGYSVPTALSLQIGRRKSRLNVKAGYYVNWMPGYVEGSWPCPGYCDPPPQHRLFFSLGYMVQQHRGFFFGVNAYGFIHLIPKGDRYYYVPVDGDVFPWGGLSFGYRVPSRVQSIVWREQRAGRVLRSLDEKAQKAEVRKEQHIERNERALHRELETLARMNERRKLEEERMERIAHRDQRDNGPHNVFVEVLGAGHTWSVNYQHSRQLKENSIVHAFGRGGLGGISGGALNSNVALAIPLAGGIQLFKNYRGGGIGLGAVPVFRRQGNPTMLGFVGIDAHFHLAHGLTFGAGYQLMYDPDRAYGRGDLFMFGGFSLGYRFKKRPST